MTTPTAPHRPSPTWAAAGPRRPTLPRQELLAALLAERFGPPPPPPAPAPGAALSRRHAVPGAEHTNEYVLRLAGYGWTANQISATTGLTKQQVQRVLRDHRPAPAEPEGEEP